MVRPDLRSDASIPEMPYIRITCMSPPVGNGGMPNIDEAPALSPDWMSD